MHRSTARHLALSLLPLLAILAARGWAQPAASSPEPVVGLPCEGCEAIFVGMPMRLEAKARLAPPDEPGEPLRIRGRVTAADGRPVAGVIVYGYQTDATGRYPPGSAELGPSAARHGRLRGWAKSDAQGEFLFETVRPGGYPGTDIPQHVHLHVLEPGRCTYYIDDLLFADDPRLTAEKRSSYLLGRGGNGLAKPERGSDGVWEARRDIRLGERIPGYPARR